MSIYAKNSNGEVKPIKINVNGIQGPKGDKGDIGPQGPTGPKGEQGKDGLTTSVKVGSQTFTQNEGLITLTGIATENFVTTKISEAQLSGGTGSVDLSGYATKDELNAKADKTAIPTKTSQLENDSSYLKSIDTIDADSLNGKKFSDPMTKEEYDAIVTKDPNMIYLVGEDNVINGIPDYTSSDANKILAVNAEGNALGWIDKPAGGSSESVKEIYVGSIEDSIPDSVEVIFDLKEVDGELYIDGSEGNGLTVEQAKQLTAAYEHSQSPHITSSDLTGYATETYVDNKIGDINTILDNINGEVI